MSECMEKARDSATEENNINPTTIFGDVYTVVMFYLILTTFLMASHSFLLIYCRQHETDVWRQKVIHLVALKIFISTN